MFVLSVSTKASLPPLMAFSTAGELTERESVVRVSKVSASPSGSNMSAQLPPRRSATHSSVVFRRRTVQA